MREISYKRTPLFNIDKDATPQLVQLLISAGANVDARDKTGDTPLHSALGSAAEDVVGVLIDAGADVNFKNKSGATPLMYAAERNETGLVALLVNKGADVNATDDLGRSAWDRSTQTEIDDLLVAAGARISYEVEVEPEIASEDTEELQADSSVKP